MISENGDIKNISDSNISRCCNKKRKSAGGFVWEYELGGGDLLVM